MSARGARIIAVWLAGTAAALWIVVHARYITDLSAFLPSKPTPMQRLLVDQLRDGPGSRLLLMALEKGDSGIRAQISAAMTRRLRSDQGFSSVDNGEPLSAERDRDFVFQHRYLLSDAVNEQRFSPAGLTAAIEDTIETLASPTGLMLKSLVPRDPTGETLRVIDQMTRMAGPRMRDGAWSSSDGTRTLLVAQTAASGSDTDAQERDIAAIRAAFQAAATAAGPPAAAIQMKVSGPGAFAVVARATIKQAATRLSILSSVLVVAVLLAVYRSMLALALGLLPVATGALVGIASVALGFGAVHGITLGFGVTLIGESVDYSVYFFVRSASQSWQQLLWPTIRLGMLTSVCGFASLLPSGFPGLAQLGLYSISGLIAAALVTRFVLPQLVPPGFSIRDVTPLGLRFGRARDAIRRRGTFAIAGIAGAIALAAILVLYRHHDSLWNRELSALSPVPIADQRYDALLRADLGAADLLSIIVVSGPDLQSALNGAERVGSVLQPLIDGRVIGGFDSPATYLPSLAMQEIRRRALPDERTLRDNLQPALVGVNLKDDRLEPFIRDIQLARRAAPITADDLHGTSFAAGFSALILHEPDHWSALLPLHPVDGATTPGIDAARIGAALATAGLPDTQLLDLKAQTDALYAGYLHEAIRLSLLGLAFIVVLLLVALRSALRVLRILAPLILAVLSVAAILVLFGQRLNILHLVGMLLIIAVGSNYALFFDEEYAQRQAGTSPLMVTSLGIANLSTVIGFGLLAFSQVPVLEALGMTVAPGTFLALLFSAAITSRAPATTGVTSRFT
jgi:predicted exporter